MDDDNETYGELLHVLEPQTREGYRTLEKIKKKLISRKYAGLYNDFCIKLICIAKLIGLPAGI